MAIVNKHDVERSVSLFKILSIIGIVGFIGWSVWAIVIKPVVSPIQTTSQYAEKIQNVNITESDDRFFIGVKLFGLKIGLSKPVKVKVPSIKDVK